MSGTLYLIGTPIGNLEDISYRAVRILKEADLIAAEDTRNSIRLLNHFDIHTPMTSYHEFNKIDKGRDLVETLLSGKDIALVTDAGMPGISDPGEELVRMCIDAGVEVTTVPGPTAFVSAAVMSGLPCRRLAFEAFLPREKKDRARILFDLKAEKRTILIYEAPHHLKRTLKDLEDALGGDRDLVVAREITKKFEEKIHTTLSGAVSYYVDREPRGEYVLVIRGRSKEEEAEEERKRWEGVSLPDHVGHYLKEGLSKKDAMKAAARDLGITKREVYSALEKDSEGGENGRN